MKKKKLTPLLAAIVALIFAFQFFTDEENGDLPPISDGTETEVAVTDEVDTPTETADVTITAEPPTKVPTETPILPDDPFDNLEEADGDFDYWVMALSWSPDYCATNDYQDEQQCSIGRQLDFVLHGLWPQYEDGWPSYCSTEELPDDLKNEYGGLYPNDKLFDHEWEKHGTCSGLSPEGYLAWSKALKEGLIIPAEYDSPLEPFRTDAESLQAAFVADNPTFSESAFAVYCSGSGRFLKEIFVCYEKDGNPRECSSEVLSRAARSCGQPDLLVRNTR